jgi:hypothetical protein
MKKHIFHIIVFSMSFLLGACKSFVAVQPKKLYDVVPLAQNDDIDGFNNLVIFQDDYDNSIWVSPEKQCIQVQRVTTTADAGKASLHVSWNKITGGCKWLGMGFGWNNWLPKDMLDITQTTAVQLKVKSAKGSFSNLPVAFAFEDYQGTQIYAGFDKSMCKGLFTDTAWNTVSIPLNKFRFDRPDFNAEQVKQFIIQWEADGDIYLDDIKIIRWQP